ncbi:phosphate acyltransferase [Desulfolithobacter dissulfuricans]|uniref:Phosphate acyltransferase n=1 Tax=Desulfolithobacter dissulfuricans TaxID=2795293 RepID=A0A915TZ72_9BACT|nr:phosphate acyltransferase PlsX [Desulfolithobacter dissulfuricans]BCO08648.1 phosphate acyltransferase [Desulfolithobacter dissulfuricans]
MRIALDAMGGDCGSELLIEGALAAVRDNRDFEVVLLGPSAELEKQVALLADTTLSSRLSIQHASQVVSMHESPVEAVRKKKDSTIMVGFDLVRQGKADAVVSAGNSGATLAAAVRKLGRLKGVARPGIASLFPTLKEPVILMDIGANVDCRPQHLFQFAIMAASCSRLLLGIERPRVGLLSIGEESGKGNALVKETHVLLRQSGLNFIGNVEGRDVYQGDVDVIVCDGFVGNISLKISEGLAEAAMQMLKDEIMKSLRAKIGYLLIRKAFARFRKRVDYAEYGGAPLLGIDGVGIICHGKSNAIAIKNGIEVAADMVRSRVNDSIRSSLEEYAT